MEETEKGLFKTWCPACQAEITRKLKKIERNQNKSQDSCQHIKAGGVRSVMFLRIEVKMNEDIRSETGFSETSVCAS